MYLIFIIFQATVTYYLLLDKSHVSSSYLGAELQEYMVGNLLFSKLGVFDQQTKEHI